MPGVSGTFETREPGFYPENPRTFWQRMADMIREDPKKLIARSQNAYAYSEAFGITPSEAFDYGELLDEKIFGEKLSTPELIGGLAILPITAALATNPLGLLLRVGAFQIVAEAESAAVNLVKGERYQVFRNKGIAELLPEESSALVSEVVETLDLMGKMVAAEGVFRGAPKLSAKVARKIMVDNKLPQELYISGKELKSELQTGGILPNEAMEAYKALGLTGAEVRTALHKGISIRIPAERIITITDRPWYAKFKKLFKMSPYEEVRVMAEGKPTYEFVKEIKFKDSVEAEEFGRGASREQIEQIETLREESAALRDQAIAAGEGEIAMEHGMDVQRYNDAIRASEGGQTLEEIKAAGEIPEGKTAFDLLVETMPEKIRKGKKVEGVRRILDLLDEKYPKVSDQINRIIYSRMRLRHGEVMGRTIVLSTVDAPTLGHEIGELLQPVPQLGRGRTITGGMARDRDNLSDAVAYILIEEAGMKPPRKKPTPEMIDKARELLTGEEPEIPPPSMEDIRLEAAKDIESPKTRIRLITGQTKISELVREDVAFAAALRRAAKEARHAMSEGKKEGYDKAKKHYLELRDRAKKREAQRKYVQNLVNNITRPLGNSIDFAYKEAIENMREGIDPHFRSEKSLRAKERMQKFFEDNPDKLADMPVKFMKSLSKKPLNEYTIDDLVEISNEVSKLRKLGRTKRKLLLAQKNREFETEKDDMIVAISKKGKGRPEGEPIVKSTKDKAGKISSFRVLTLRPSRIFDKLDGGQQFSGPVHKFFYDEVNKGIDASYRGIDKRLEAGRKIRKSLKMSTRALSKTYVIGKVKITLDEMLDIYAGWKNPRKRLALMFGNNVTEEMHTEIVNKLTDEQKEFADWIISEYESNYNRVREAHIEYSNEDMGHEAFYTPIRRTDVLHNTHKGELAEEILIRSNLKKAYIGRRFTFERKDIPKEFQRPLRLGLYSTWLDQVPKQERYVALGAKVKDMQKLTSDPDFRKIVREHFGPEFMEALEHYNNRVANPSIYKAFTRAEKISQTLRKNMVVAYLSFNLVTMGKQLPSVLLYLPEAGPAHLIEAMLEFVSNPFKIIKFVNDRDPQVKHRMIERELVEMKYSGKILKKTGRSGMKGIRLMDKLAVTIGWRAVYNRNVGRVGEAEAIRLAQNATLRTQPAAHAKDLPEIYTTNEMLNWMLQFTNQLNQIYNIASYDIPQDVKRGRLYKALLSSLALAMVSLVIWTMTKRRLPEDASDIREALTEEAISAIPVVGKVILSASHGYEQSTPAVKTAVTAGKLISNAERETKVREVIESIAVATGTPYTGPKRVVEALSEEDAWLLLGHKKEKEGVRKRYE